MKEAISLQVAALANARAAGVYARRMTVLVDAARVTGAHALSPIWAEIGHVRGMALDCMGAAESCGRMAIRSAARAAAVSAIVLSSAISAMGCAVACPPSCGPEVVWDCRDCAVPADGCAPCERLEALPDGSRDCAAIRARGLW